MEKNIDVKMSVVTELKLQKVKLYLAIRFHKADDVEELLKLGVDSDTRFITSNFELPAICIAVKDGVYDVVSALCRGGCSVHQRDSFGRTPLHISIAQAHFKIMRLLLQYGARANTKDNCGVSPIESLIENLPDRKTSWDHQKDMERAVEILVLLKAHGADLTVYAQPRYPLLHQVCSKGLYSVANYFLKKGVSAKQINDQMQTAYHQLTITRSFYKDLANLLYEHGADVNARDEIERLPMELILESNVYNRDEIRAVKWFLQHGSGISGDHILRVGLSGNVQMMRVIILYACDKLDGVPCFVYLTHLVKMARSLSPDMVQMMVKGGSRLVWNCFDELNSSPNNNYLVATTQLKQLSLQDACRISLLRKYGRNYVNFVNSQHPPTIMKEYLLFNNISKKK